ncbi:probable poly(beta-D-mannuronate) O-acetylase [Lachnospiraceae bacterium KM106-2]|nr:probable poly(beta-D-mannuronate) O-acetylase [Lachnospiraceae bacterium KM106-2]
MVFSSLLFLFRFLPIVLLVYYLAPKSIRNAILFACSLVFYAWGEPVYVVLMLFSTVVDYTHGRLVQRYLDQDNEKKAKIAVLSSVIINLGLLGFFKYSDFVISNINGVFGTDINMLHLALPIGISFYTFQTMSYTIDVYRREAHVQKNIISFGAYVALFPQLIAGPIVQYKTVAKELDMRKESVDEFSQGITKFMLGLGKKVLLANNIGLLWNELSTMPSQELTVVTAWLGALAFTFQIYFDFSGYSDMAIGLGQMFGFHFLENFNYPYMATSITDFWRRWHISLGTWFKEYVYIPLGGNRKGLKKQFRNIAIVWLLTGLWHGASWNFVLWGAYFGILLMIEKFFLLERMKQWPAFIGRIYTLFFVIVSWVIFAFDNMSQVRSYLSAMFGVMGSGFCNQESFYLLSSYGILFIILILASTDFPKRFMFWLQKKYYERTAAVKVCGAIVENVYLITIFILAVAFLVDDSYNPFLYFRF